MKEYKSEWIDKFCLVGTFIFMILYFTALWKTALCLALAYMLFAMFVARSDFRDRVNKDIRLYKLEQGIKKKNEES